MEYMNTRMFHVYVNIYSPTRLFCTLMYIMFPMDGIVLSIVSAHLGLFLFNEAGYIKGYYNM